MKVKLLDSGEILEGGNALEIIKQLNTWRTEETLESYMEGIANRFKIAYNIDLHYTDTESFLYATHNTGKFLKILEE